MAAVEITLNAPRLRRITATPEAVINAAAARALTRTADSAHVLMVRSVASDMGVNQSAPLTRGKSLQDLIRVYGASADRLESKVSPSRTRIPLVKFNATGPNPSRGRGAGVVARVQGGRQVYRSAFLATMPSGHLGVFKRTEPSRLPIAELFGPSPAQVFKRFHYVVFQRGLQNLRKNLAHEIRFALSRSAA